MAFKFGANSVITLQQTPQSYFFDSPVLASPAKVNITTGQFNNINVYGQLRFRRVGIESDQGGVGQTYGIHIGGAVFPTTQSGTWKRYAFASDAPTAAKVPVIYTSALVPSYMGTGWSSMTTGLFQTGVPLASTRVGVTAIAKFPFAFTTTAGEGFSLGTANLILGRYYMAGGGGGMQSTEYAFAVGGFASSLAAVAQTIEVFPLTLSGDYALTLTSTFGPGTTGRASGSIVNSPNIGYVLGGTPGSPAYPTAVGTNTIIAWPFASIQNESITATTLSAQRGSAVSFMSPTFGYIAAGAVGPFATVSTTNNVEKFPYASVIPVATVVASTPARAHATSHSSPTSGYILGGSTLGQLAPSPGGHVLSTLRLPFASDTSLVAHATLVGNDQSAVSQASCAV